MNGLVIVEQGEPLSPLLFIVFLNDLTDELESNTDYFDDNSEFIDQFQKFILLLAETNAELQRMLNKLCI